jgi:hypothetical protein
VNEKKNEKKEPAFNTTAIGPQSETSASAVAAQMTAMVQARYMVALNRPRDMDQVRVALLKECARPGFAAVARYFKPVGKGVTGPTIRFAEAAIRCLTNVLVDSVTVFDDVSRRIVRVTVTDLEANVPYSKDVTVDKTVERSVVKPGTTILSSRENSLGKTTYLVPATEDDLLNKEGALVSKAIRTLALRILPGDLLEESMLRVVSTLEARVKSDPDAERKALADAFAGLGVQPKDLSAYLGHDLGQVTPAELTDLRLVFTSVRDGEASWAELLSYKFGGPFGEAPNDKPVAPAKPKSSDQLKAEAAAAKTKTASTAGPA